MRATGLVRGEAKTVEAIEARVRPEPQVPVLRLSNGPDRTWNAVFRGPGRVRELRDGFLRVDRVHGSRQRKRQRQAGQAGPPSRSRRACPWSQPLLTHRRKYTPQIAFGTFAPSPIEWRRSSPRDLPIEVEIRSSVAGEQPRAAVEGQILPVLSVSAFIRFANVLANARSRLLPRSRSSRPGGHRSRRIAPVDERHVDRRRFQRACCAKTSEATAGDHDLLLHH